MSVFRSNSFLTLLFLFGSLMTAPAITVVLDIAGANFMDNFATDGEIRWNNIARDPDSSGPSARIDLVATVATGSSYTPGDGAANANGNANNSIPLGSTRLKVQVGTDVTFNFNFVRGNPAETPIAITTSLAFLDFDQTFRESDGVTVTENIQFLGVNSSDVGSYTYASTNLIATDTNNPLGPVFSSIDDGGQADNPTTLNTDTNIKL